MTIEIVGIDVLGGGEDMTKYICNGRSTSGITCHTICTCEMGVGIRAPTECLLDDRECTWRRDCTEERSSAVFDAFAGVDNRVCHLEKKVQELERELKNHYHDTGFPK
jgi:hypothetical protein